MAIACASRTFSSLSTLFRSSGAIRCGQPNFRRTPTTWCSMFSTQAPSSPRAAPAAPDTPPLMPHPNPLPSDSKSFAESVKPGVAEDVYFPPTDNTLFWRTYTNPDGPQSFTQRFADHGLSIPRAVLGNPSLLQYWLFSSSRLAFFSLSPTILSMTGITQLFLSNVTPDSVLKGTLQRFNESVFTLRQDFECIQSNRYKLPWDMSLSHRQNNPLFVLQQMRLLAEDSSSMLSAIANKETSVWMESPFLPQYYKQRYHYQTDGWLSSSSSNIYELSTEVLFFGRQDAMQRTTLLPITKYIRHCGIPEKELNIVELGAGTGRFATFVRDNWPQAQYTISDLSPFYLEKARENMKYWERKRGNSSEQLGKVRFLQTAAEDLPLNDESVEILYSVYLFHELPPEVRRKVVSEAERVLKPGGLFVITDSIQLGDMLTLDKGLSVFKKLNEPWYESYVGENFVEMVCGDGKFKPMMKEVRSRSKMLSFTKACA